MAQTECKSLILGVSDSTGSKNHNSFIRNDLRANKTQLERWLDPFKGKNKDLRLKNDFLICDYNAAMAK